MSHGVVQWGEATAKRPVFLPDDLGVIEGSLEVQGDLSVGGETTLDDATVEGDLAVEGEATLGDTTVEGAFATEGASSIDGADLSIPNLPAVDPEVVGQAFQNGDDLLEISAGA